jgi:hypothetical protein
MNGKLRKKAEFYGKSFWVQRSGTHSEREVPNAEKNKTTGVLGKNCPKRRGHPVCRTGRGGQVSADRESQARSRQKIGVLGKKYSKRPSKQNFEQPLKPSLTTYDLPLTIRIRHDRNSYPRTQDRHCRIAGLRQL